MPRYILKLEDSKGESLYCEWSTVVDAPVSWLVPLRDFIAHYKQQYGEEGMRGLEERMERVEAKGSSDMYGFTAATLIQGNRAGDEEQELTRDQIIENYRGL